MARKFWTLLPEAYYTHKQLAKGGRNEILFAAVGSAVYYLFYTSFHSKPAAGNDLPLFHQGKRWF